MAKPDDRPTDTPTTSTAEAADEGARMARNWFAIASISILATLLVIIVVMQWTGLLDVGAPLVGSEGGQWIVVGAIALAIAIIAGWGWRAVTA